MAMTHDYLEYLDEQIGISPASSQEELQAAQTISDLMKQHDIETEIEEFDARTFSKVGPAVILTLLFLGAFLLAIGSGAVTVVGLLLVVATMAVLVLRYLGTDVLSGIGGTSRSQNVVAHHAAEGELAAKGNRPIVVVAHYDSPHESFLNSSAISPYVPQLKKYSPYLALCIALCAFIRILVFIPAPARRVISWIGFIAAIPLLLIAVGVFAERFSPCTLGANNNKSGVAAMLGVLENVCPTGKAPVTHRPHVTPALAAAPVPPAPEPVLGVRHGKDVVESLGILPETCEIDYIDRTPADSHEESQEEPEGSQTAPLDVPNEPEATADLEEVRSHAGSTAVSAPVVEDEESDDSDAAETAFDPGATQPVSLVDDDPRSATPDDADWGKTTYAPRVSDVARRASLFDLPDPSEASSDPFAADPGATRVAPSQGQRVNMAQKLAQNNENNAHRIRTSSSVPTIDSDSLVPPAVAPLDTLSGSRDAEPAEKKHRFRIFGNKHGNDDGDDWDDDSNGWKGGATTRSGLRMVDGDEDDSLADATNEDELRDAVLSMSDDELISHDIWFVALGASSIDHAGMKAFLGKHRSSIRGAFLINLDCVGAGSLTALNREGLLNVRRADRRLLRLLSGTASDLHIPLMQKELDWGTTDATPAMRQSVRAITIVGMGENGMPALSKTSDDSIENVDADQAASVAALVTEMIKRS